MPEKDVSAILRIEGGLADEGLLDIYDAASTIYGLARSVNIVTHAFVNNDEVRSRAKTAHGAQAFIHSSRKGCFEEQVDIRFSKKSVDKFGHSVLANNFWDYITWCWSAAIGSQHEPTTPYLRRTLDRDSEFIHVMADALETPMQELHKSIVRDEHVKIFLQRPRVGDVVVLDKNSLEYVSVRDEEEERINIEGNVTRYNVLSDFGRLYSDVDGKTVSFRLARHDARMSSLAVDSMQKMIDGEEGKLNLLVSRVVSAEGVVKRYIVHDILKKRM